MPWMPPRRLPLSLAAMALLSVSPGKGAEGEEVPEIRAPRAPAGAPNAVIVLLDDVGFGAASSFGGPVETPTLDGLAAVGLR